MKKFIIKNRIKYINLVVLVSLLFLFVNLQKNVTQVEAQILPVDVSVHHLDFGTVFPGESLEGEFQVMYAEESGGVFYQIIQKRKPLGEDHPEYPNGGDPDMPGYYRDLCPFMEKVSLEGEGDFEGPRNQAYVGTDDLSDTWTIYFKVPAIFGNVAQDHEGSVVSENGEYGCDISIEVVEG